MTTGLTPSVWAQSPLPWEQSPQATVLVWTFPSLNQVTTSTVEQAMLIALATYANLRWPLHEWAHPDTTLTEPKHTEVPLEVLALAGAALAFALLML